MFRKQRLERRFRRRLIAGQPESGVARRSFFFLADQRERIEKTPLVGFFEDTLMFEGTVLIPMELEPLEAFPWLGEEDLAVLEIQAAKRKSEDEEEEEDEGDEDDELDDFDDEDDDLDDDDFDEFDDDEDFDEFDDDDDDLDDDLDDDDEEEEDM